MLFIGCDCSGFSSSAAVTASCKTESTDFGGGLVGREKEVVIRREREVEDLAGKQ